MNFRDYFEHIFYSIDDNENCIKVLTRVANSYGKIKLKFRRLDRKTRGKKKNSQNGRCIDRGRFSPVMGLFTFFASRAIA